MALTYHLQYVDVELVFGCGYEQRGCAYEFGPGKVDTLPSDGIMGLSRKEAAIPAQLHAECRMVLLNAIRHLHSPCYWPLFFALS
ncbi:aspartyl protease APCB1-like isoform X3 [Physcomitrium patens]|uniref:Uncharacterized protein n=1 Tax=Physcomitrium patens TaxID=3218 RepID=A0A7I4AZW7_PHYPA